MTSPAERTPGTIAAQLSALLSDAAPPELPADTAARFETYLELLLRWNARTNLTAIRDPEGILRRHFLESIACARHLPAGIRTLLDLGSGAGFPGIPIALCRPELAVTLAESQGKKAAFLREAVRVLDLPARVHAARAEILNQAFDCVTLRAVDRMAEAVRVAATLVVPGGWLAPLTTRLEAAQLESAAGAAFTWQSPIKLPGGSDRILLLGCRRS